MLSYHNDPEIKAKYLARVAAHRAADELVQGIGWENGKGCAIGCTLEAYDHAQYPIELGIPIELARLEDRIFESLPPSEAQAWPERVLSAIAVGRDLSLVWPRFAVWMLRDLEAQLSAQHPRQAKACADAAALYDRWIAGSKPASHEWLKARGAASGAADAAIAAGVVAADAAAIAAYAARADYAARTAAWDAAWAAAYAADVAASAASDDAWAAWAAARADYAARAAARAAAYAAARAAAYAAAASVAADAAAASAAAARRSFWTAAASKLEDLLKSA